MSKFMDSHLRSAHSAVPGGCRHEGSHWPFRVTLAGGYGVTPLLQVGKQAGSQHTTLPFMEPRFQARSAGSRFSIFPPQGG